MMQNKRVPPPHKKLPIKQIRHGNCFSRNECGIFSYSLAHKEQWEFVPMTVDIDTILLACALVEEDQSITTKIEAVVALQNMLAYSRKDTLYVWKWYCKYVNKNSRFSPY